METSEEGKRRVDLPQAPQPPQKRARRYADLDIIESSGNILPPGMTRYRQSRWSLRNASVVSPSLSSVLSELTDLSDMSSIDLSITASSDEAVTVEPELPDAQGIREIGIPEIPIQEIQDIHESQEAHDNTNNALNILTHFQEKPTLDVVTVAANPCGFTPDESQQNDTSAQEVGEFLEFCIDEAVREDVRPPANGGPPAWADNRQAPVECLPWFKCMQSGMHTRKKLLVGLFLDSQAEDLDQIQGQVIIASVGGGREQNEHKKMVRRSDQKITWRVEAYIQAMRQKQPVGVIVGKNQPKIQVKPPHEYNVLDYFHVTDVWAEKQLAVTASYEPKLIMVWKCRLEKVDLESSSWWAPANDWRRFTPGQFVPLQRRCDNCAQESDQIFQQQWTCLNHECAEFFLLPNDINVSQLAYANDFLNKRALFSGVLTEPLVQTLDIRTIAGHGTEKESRFGGICPKCKRCSERIYWDRFVCPACCHTVDLPILPCPIATIAAEQKSFQESPNGEKSFSFNKNLIAFKSSLVAGYRVEQFLVPGPSSKVIGTITIFRATDAVREELDGPNEMWTHIQKENHGLRRNPAVRGADNKSRVLTRHFARNFGAPYKFAVPVASVSFEEAPDTVLRARCRLSWAGQEAIRLSQENLSEEGIQNSLDFEFVPFNELLSLGYRETDHINFHDDGEDTLGPTVATLSLGSPSVMRFQVKKKSACQQLLNNLKDAVVVSFPLYHGDMAVMHGTEIHRHYEHEVKPKGVRRYALTCRYIVPEKLHPDEREDAARKGAVPARALSWTYNGN